MNIAICDDDLSEIARISSFLDAYNHEKGTLLTYTAYQSAADLLATSKVNRYDLLLLDILMPGFTGIQAAREVRDFDNNVKIIFLTSSVEFALESYSVKAMDYILKPVPKEKLFLSLDAIFEQEQIHSDCFAIKTHGGVARVLFSKIVYIEVINKRLYFHMSDGCVREVFSPLVEYENTLLDREEFIKVHRSYIVNLEHMSELTQGEFISTGGNTIPISRLLYAEVRRAYMDHLFAKSAVK
ncbi:MAG: LytTR family DNA-binding domain-containing protein [Oscillospiraceae bacterium]